jgi:NAD(P)H-nitrite reductase large subunit
MGGKPALVEVRDRRLETLNENQQGSYTGWIMQADDTVCYCFHVTWRKLENWARRHRPPVASQLSDCGGAGTGCGWCIPFLRLIHRRVLDESSRSDPQPMAQQPEAEAALITLTAEEYAALRAEYIRAGRGKPPAPASLSPES